LREDGIDDQECGNRDKVEDSFHSGIVR
jgi:hypothetical protein